VTINEIISLAKMKDHDHTSKYHTSMSKSIEVQVICTNVSIHLQQSGGLKMTLSHHKDLDVIGVDTIHGEMQRSIANKEQH